MCKVVNKYTEPYDIYIGRGSKWGNPFTHKDGTKAEFKVATREKAIQAYKQWITQGNGKHLLNDLHELKGKTIACYCKPKACHGDVLKELVEALPQGNKPMHTWARKSNEIAIECSSIGIKELSALYAKLPSGRTIEEHYQCDVKGYDVGGTNWRLGKGKPPLKKYTGDELYLAYLGLWQSYFMYNPHLLLGIYGTGITLLTDTFASTQINQARAIADCMNAVCFKQLFVDGAVLNQYQQKDAQKARFANKFIGRGSSKSSTAQYARVYGTEANSGTYTPTDVVYVSVEGNRANRKPLDTVELQKALDARSFIIADKPYDRNRPYNVGERELAEYLITHEYVEMHATGIWMHLSHKK